MVTDPLTAHTQVAPDEPMTSFERFYAVYARKKSKGQARKTWAKLVKAGIITEGAMVDRIVAAAKAQSKWPEYTKDSRIFMPHPSTWLNAEGWDNEADKPVEAAKKLLKERMRAAWVGRDNYNYHTILTLHGVGTDEEIWSYEADYYAAKGVAPSGSGRWHKDKPPQQFVEDRK